MKAVAAMPPNTEPNTLRVFIIREPFDDYYLLINQNGHSEEMDEMQVREWLSERGALEELVDKVVAQAWNFYSAMCLIRNPKTPIPVYDPLSPQISV